MLAHHPFGSRTRIGFVQLYETNKYMHVSIKKPKIMNDMISHITHVAAPPKVEKSAVTSFVS